MIGRALRRAYWQALGWARVTVHRHRAWLPVPARRMREGVGRGLRFDPGPSNPDYATGRNELPVQLALAEHLGAGDVFYDVGANVGFFTVIAARLVGEAGHVYAFEPVAGNAALIRRNAALNRFRNVTVVERAVSEHSGPGQLRLAHYSGGAALATVPPPPDAAGIVAVTLTSLDDAIRHEGRRQPSLVKVDVEGAEAEVLRGMTWTLQHVRPLVVCEIDDERVESFDRKRMACEELLRAAGYETTRLEASYPHIRWLVGHVLGVPCGRARSGG